MNDVETLQNIDAKGREEIARKVARILVSGASSTDLKASLELTNILVEDVAVSVRQVLAAELRHCNFLPKEIVKTIVEDIEEVSLPFVMASSAIDDELLEEIVHNFSENAQKAVAGRKCLSEAICFVISDIGAEVAVETLVGNETADISHRSCERVVSRFPNNRSLMESLAARSDLPVDIVERLIFKVSQKYGEYLAEKFALSTDYSSYLVSLANRQVFSRTLEMAPLSEVENYLAQLNDVKALGSDMLLSFLQNGHVRIFTASLAVLVDLPYEAIEKRLVNRDKKVLARLLEVAGFSKSVIGVLLIAFERLSRG